MTNAEHINNLIQISAGRRLGRKPVAKKQILPNRQMRKKPPFLKDIPNTAAVWRQPQPLIRITQNPAIQGNTPMVRAQQTGNRVHHGCLARSGPPKQDG